MILRTLKLTNFRNHRDFQVDFGPLTIFVGPNGSGKTNLLEAIFVLSTGSSWRTRKEEEVIAWSSNFFRLEAELSGEDQKKIEIIFSKKEKDKKIIKINGLGKRTIDLLGTLPVVLFTPENLDIVTGAPRSRRRFLDLLLAQTDKEYARSLILLQRVLRARNALLLGINLGKNKEEELNFWNQKLIMIGSELIKKRMMASQFFNNFLTKYYSKISPQKGDCLKIKYLSTVSRLEKYADLLFSQREKEIAYSASLYGPHRDELKFFLNHQEVKPFASRGEIRSIILALKQAELEFLRAKLSKEPLLLLDDIFSELDKKRRSSLLAILRTQQTILTTTDLEGVPPEIRNKGKIVNLRINGKD